MRSQVWATRLMYIRTAVVVTEINAVEPLKKNINRSRRQWISGRRLPIRCMGDRLLYSIHRRVQQDLVGTYLVIIN